MEQAAFNLRHVRKVKRFGCILAPSDNVMLFGNHFDKKVYNGDIVHVVDVVAGAGAAALPAIILVLGCEDRHPHFCGNDRYLRHPARRARPNFNSTIPKKALIQ